MVQQVAITAEIVRCQGGAPRRMPHRRAACRRERTMNDENRRSPARSGRAYAACCASALRSPALHPQNFDRQPACDKQLIRLGNLFALSKALVLISRQLWYWMMPVAVMPTPQSYSLLQRLRQIVGHGSGVFHWSPSGRLPAKSRCL